MFTCRLPLLSRPQLMATLPWTPATAAVHQYLTAALSHRGAAALPYTEEARWTIHQHLAALSHAFPTLRPTAGHFTHNDGRGATLLRAEGTIPLATSSSACLSISIWLLEAYPNLPPAVFLSFPPGTAVKPRHPLVDPSGSVSVPYLRSWIFPYYNLVDLVRSLGHLFSQDPPFAISPSAIHDAKARETAKVVEAVQRHLAAAGKSHTAEMEALLDTQTQLKRRKAEIARGLTRLEEEKELLEQQLQMLIMNCDVMESWVAKNHRRPTASLDGVFEPSNAHSTPAMECVAADMAAEDVMYALDEALREGCVPLDVYLKSVRTTSREQFFHRAISTKLAPPQFELEN
ncbi:unnamed protein product [Musa hybrid cultivar]